VIRSIAARGCALAILLDEATIGGQYIEATCIKKERVSTGEAIRLETRSRAR